MPDNHSQQVTTRHDGASMIPTRMRRVVIKIVVINLYVVAMMLSLGQYVISGAGSILLGQLTAAISLGLWGVLAVFLACDIDRCWGHTRLEHIITSVACVCIGLAMYDSLANLLLNLSLPTLSQLAPPIAALDASGIGVPLIIVAPIIVFITIQQRRAGAKWWE